MVDSGPSVSEFLAGDSRLLIDYAARSVYVDGSEVALTPTEFEVLSCLAQRAGTVVSTTDLIQAVWGEWFGPVDHVFVHVHHIRRKLGPCGSLIVTKRRAGYLLRVESRDAHPDVPWSYITREYSALLQDDAHAQGSIWLLVDRDRTVTWISDSITALLGWVPADVLGKHPWVIAPPGEWEKFEMHFPVVGGSPLVSFPARVRDTNGDLVPIHVHGQVILGADGRRLGGIGEWRVVRPGNTSRDEPLARHEMPFRLHYDGDHVLTSVEPHQAFLGWEPDDVIGTHFSLAGLDREATDKAVSALISLGQDHALGRSPVRRADGTSAIVDVRLRLTLEDGVLTGYVGEVRVLD